MKQHSKIALMLWLAPMALALGLLLVHPVVHAHGANDGAAAACPLHCNGTSAPPDPSIGQAPQPLVLHAFPAALPGDQADPRTSDFADAQSPRGPPSAPAFR